MRISLSREALTRDPLCGYPAPLPITQRVPGRGIPCCVTSASDQAHAVSPSPSAQREGGVPSGPRAGSEGLLSFPLPCSLFPTTTPLPAHRACRGRGCRGGRRRGG